MMPRKQPERRSVRERVREEVRKVLGIALFFAAGLSIIIFADSLTVRGTNVTIGTYLQAVVGGLIVAKVLLLTDLLPVVDRFYGKPLMHNILWKSTIYVAASLVFRYVDDLVRSLWKGLGLSGSHHHALSRFAEPRFWAIQIWVTVILLLYVTTRELVRAIGKDELKAMFFGR
jgi:hypothetical protein